MKAIYNGHSRKSGVYKIVNTTNGRQYFGSAKRFKSRMMHHLNSLCKGSHHNKFLQNDWNKCGEEAFEFHVIEVVEGEQSIRLLAEQKYLDDFHDKQDLCYNFKKKSKAESRSCYSKSPEETRALISANSKAMWADPDLREKILSRKQEVQKTEEYRNTCSEAQKKNWENDDRRKQTSKRLREEHSNGSRKEATETLKLNQPKGRKTFTERMKSDPDFKKKYQEIGRRNIAKRNANQPVKTYGTIIAPDGTIYRNVSHVPTFAKEHGLNKQGLYALLLGKQKTHKGWKLVG